MRGLAGSLLLSALLLQGCHMGDGSQVGPRLRHPPGSFFAGVVLDPAGNPVNGALVELQGSTGRAVSGRNGRFYFEEPPAGLRLVTVKGENGTADGSDRYPTLVFLHDIPPGKGDMDRPIVLPDLTQGSSLSTVLGTLTSDLSLGGPAAPKLELTAGTTLSRGSATGSLDLGLTQVERHEFPADLPAGPSFRISTRGFWITPVDLLFTGGSRNLTLPNDLGLGAGSPAILFRLDPVTGTWNQVGAGTVQAGGTEIRTDLQDLAGGGLYAFTSSVSTSTLVTGRILDEAGNPIPGAWVSVGVASPVLADAQGSFTAGPVAALDGSGSPRTLTISLLPPLGWEPARIESSFQATAGQTTLPDFKAATFKVGTLRALASFRGRLLSRRRIQIGGGSGGFVSTHLMDDAGIFIQRDVPRGRINGRISWTEDKAYFTGGATRIFREDPFNLDLVVLVRQEDPRSETLGGRLLVEVLERGSGAFVEGARVQGGHDPATARHGLSNEFGALFLEGQRFGTFTASNESTLADGSKVLSAFTITDLDSAEAQFPVRVAKRTLSGSFDPFGLLEGNLLFSQGASKTRRLLLRPRLSVNDWWALVLDGRDLAGDLPRITDPEVSGTSYLVGLPTIEAHVTGIEGTTSGGVFLPERLGLLTDLEVEAGSRQVRDLGMSITTQDGLTLTTVGGLDAGFSSSDLRYQLGLARPDGTALDLLPESGGITVSGTDTTLPVPALAGILQGMEYLVALKARGTSGGVTRSQILLVRTGANSQDAANFLGVPQITSPAPASTVSKTEFTVSWTGPSDADLFELELSSVNGTEDRYWSVVLPGSARSFTFKTLVSEAPQILAPARTWTLELKAFRIPGGIASGARGYHDLTANLHSLRTGERGLRAMSSASMSLLTEN